MILGQRPGLRPAAVRTLALELVLLLVPLIPGPAERSHAAQAGEEEASALEAEERARLLEDLFRQGNYEEARVQATRLHDLDPSHGLPDLLLARIDHCLGNYDQATQRLDRACAAQPESEPLAAARFRLLLDLARYPEVLTIAEAALARSPKDRVAWVAKGLALEALGKRTEALASYDGAIALHNAGPGGAVSLPWIARAARRVTWLSKNPGDDLIQQGHDLLQRQLGRDPADVDARLELARLYGDDREARGQSRARRELDALLEANARLPDARVLEARIHLVFYQQANALRALSRALAVNPRHVEALAVRAAIEVANGDDEAAEATLALLAQVAPAHAEARAVRGALAFVQGREEDYEGLKKEALSANAYDGGFFSLCASIVGERQRRFNVASALAREAVRTDPLDREAYVILGGALMNLGETDEALEVLRQGVVVAKRWPDVVRDNWIEVLEEVLPSFESVSSEHFRVRLPPASARVLTPYLLPWLEEAREVLTTKYGATVPDPIQVDAFDTAPDFSVRSIGTPGLPALGVCFGRVVTLLLPTSHPLGTFSWSRTAWHEYAHVVTLAMSQGRIPRWLTEGLSVYEERARKPHWGWDQERELYDRWRNRHLIPMSELNGAFRSPDIAFAYYQGGLIVEHLVETHGFPVVADMVRAFAAEPTTEHVFREFLKTELDDYDARFRAWVAKRVGGYKIVPRWDERSMTAFQRRVRSNAKDEVAWIRMAWGHLQRGVEIDALGALAKAKALAPESPEVLLLEGRLAARNEHEDRALALYERYLKAGGDDYETRLWLSDRIMRTESDPTKAIAHLQAALLCFPYGLGSESPHRALARLYRGAGNLAAAVAEIEAYTRIAAHEYEARDELRRHYERAKSWVEVVRICEEMIDISPLGSNVRGGEPPDMELHRSFARALEALDRRPEALREWRVQVELGRLLPEEMREEAGVLGDLLDLGERLLEAGHAGEALEQAVSALRLSPESVSARELKERATEATLRR